MISFESKGDWKKTFQFLRSASNMQILDILDRYGARGVEALAMATPRDSGKTAASWTYEVGKTGNGYRIQWSNTNVNQGTNIALILQLGHGTRNGGYVQGKDYINPALKPLFDELADQAFKEVTKHE